MAAPKTLTFGKFLILVGDGLDPETFTKPCGLTSRGMSNTTNMGTVEVPDCDDEDAPAHVERSPQSKESTLSGSGVLAMGETFTTYRKWWEDGVLKNVRVHFDSPASDGGGYYQGPAYLTQFNLNAEIGGGKVSVDMAIEFDGTPVWNDAVS